MSSEAASNMYAYNDSFFDTADHTASMSAKGIISCVAEVIPAKSILDVGCGRGVWLSQWVNAGATDIVGVDGRYVDVNKLHIPKEAFLAKDISRPFDLERTFDVVQCLEVAEHVQGDAADVLIDNLVRHGSCVLFSAAIPGQGGENHINEKPWEYWRQKFFERGYDLFDYVRPRVFHEASIFFCYRHNTFLFVRRSAADRLPEAVRSALVPSSSPVRDDRPMYFKVRQSAVQMLPRIIVDMIARVKYRILSFWG